MTTATVEKMNQLTEQMTDTWLQSFGNVCWAHEQGEKIVRSMLDQGKVSREESRKLMEKMAEQTKANQEAMQRFIQGSVQMSLEALRIPKFGQVEELTAKVDELTRKVDELQKKVGK